MIKPDEIREHMEVLGSDGQHLGMVDHLEGANRIKLTKSDPKAGGQHHYIALDWVDRVDGKVHLKKTAADTMQLWEAA